MTRWTLQGIGEPWFES